MSMYDTTQDYDLLQNKVYPYLRGIVDFYLHPDPAGGGKSYLQTGADGLLHVPYSCGDEICHDELGLGYGMRLLTNIYSCMRASVLIWTMES